MKSVLNALQEGRLIELPDDDKNSALEYLAALIEAVPDIGVEGGSTESVLAREQAHNTGIGKGWACPHARSSRGLCWSTPRTVKLCAGARVMPSCSPLPRLYDVRIARRDCAVL